MRQLYLSLRSTTYQLLEQEHERRTAGYYIDIFLAGLIVANVVAVIMASDTQLYTQHHEFFDAFEWFSLAVFSVEYLLRLWSIGETTPAHASTFKARLKWARSPMAVVDLLAILPSLLQSILGIDLRILRLLRLLRILKLSRYSASLRILLKVLSRERGSLQAMVFVLMILIILAASGIHLVEHDVQPEPFGSIPRAMWWAVVSLTTVGYGDVTPVTPMGRVFGACVTVLGIGIAALPAGILASGFATELSERRKRLEQKFRSYLLSGEIDLNHRKKINMIRKELGLNKEQAQEVVLELLRENSLDHKEKCERDHNKQVGQRSTGHIICPHCKNKVHVEPIDISH